MSHHCGDPMRKKRRDDGLAVGQEELPAFDQPAFDQSAFDQLVALSASVRDEVAAEANTPPAPKGKISSLDCERKSILIPSDDAHNLLTHDRSWVFFNSIVTSQFQLDTSQFFHSRREIGRRLVADSYTGFVTLGLLKHGSI
jgi:hypothetical protein